MNNNPTRSNHDMQVYDKYTIMYIIFMLATNNCYKFICEVNKIIIFIHFSIKIFKTI